MKKKLVSICLVVLMLLAMLPTTVYAKGGGGGLTDSRGTNYDHIDVKVAGALTINLDGTDYTLNGTIQNSITVKIGETSYSGNFEIQGEQSENEYHKRFPVPLSSITWQSDDINAADKAYFKPTNVKVSFRMNFGETVDEALREYLEHDNSGYYIEVTDYQYAGLQECTGGKGRRSDGKTGTATGLDLYITADKVVEIIVPPATVSKTVTKEWNDGNNRDGIRPKSVEVQLYANDEPVEGQTATLSADNNWTHTWENLLEEDSNGATITYSVKEEDVTGYEASYDAETGVLTNTHTPETIEKLVVEKKWDDADDQDGIRPDFIEVQLYANGQKVGEAVELNAKGNWAHVWEGLYQYADGKEIAYTVEEVDVPDGYVSDPDGLTITNTHVPEITSVYVTKEWDDADDQDEIRPDSVTVRLMKNDEQYQDAVELSAKNQWTWSWQELPKYENGKEIVYTVVEDPVEGYTANYDAKTGVLTNTHTPAEPEPETVDKTVTKVWDDANNQDGIRPDSVKVQLLANGKAVGEPVELTEKGQWTYTWTGLLKFEDGEEIVYTFEEAAVEGYTAAYEGDKIVNTHTPDAVNVTVVKKWVDGDSKDRPTEITVQLYADGEALGDPVKVTKDGGWSYVWKNLPANADGKAITYTVKELNVPAAYNATYSKDTLTITNTLKDIPKSGDSANLWLYGGIMVVCAAAIVVLLTKKKRGEA